MSTEPMTIAVTPKPPPQRTGWGRSWRYAGPALAVLAGASVLAEHGFYSPLVATGYCRAAQLAAVLLFLADRIVCAQRCRDAGHWISQCWLEAMALPAGAIAAGARGVPMVTSAITAGAIYVVVRQAAAWTSALLHRALRAAAAPAISWRAVRLITGTYLLMVLIGGALLALPAATVSDHRNSPYTHTLNSLFLAGSAATSTGLTVYEFPAEYTLLGRIVVLALVQAGGLAAMIFGTLFGLALVRSLWPGSSVWAGGMDLPRLKRLVKAIALATLGLEALGAVLIYPLQPAESGLLVRLFHSVFLAISAFCNAGLSLERNSLVEMAGFGRVYAVILPLMVLGGLGFPVMYEIAWRLRGSARRPKRVAALLPLPQDRWSLHSRLVIGVTLCLIVVGAAGLWYFETPWRHGGFWYVGNSNMLSAEDSIQTSLQTMRGHTSQQRVYDALFQSVSARTTGFRTVLIKPGAISPASLTLMIGLMLIGGSPGSTAGGFHTIAFAIVGLAAVSTFRRHGQPPLLGMAIPDAVARRVFAVFLAGTCWLGLTILVLAHMQRSDFMAIVFEATSALSTNGLSLGITPSLTVAGKVMLLLTMLVGRIGPLGLMLVMAGGDAPDTDHGPATGQDHATRPADEPIILG